MTPHQMLRYCSNASVVTDGREQMLGLFSEQTPLHDILQPWKEAVGVPSQVRVSKRQREEAGA